MSFYQDMKMLFTAVFQIAFGIVALITATPIYMLILGAVIVVSFWLGGYVAGTVCFVVAAIWFLSSIHIRVTKQELIPGMVVWTILALLAFGYLFGYKFGYEIVYPKAKKLYYGENVVDAQNDRTKAKREQEVRSINKDIAGTRIEYVLAEDIFYLNCNNGGGCSGTYQIGNQPLSEKMIQIRALNEKVTLANKLILEKVVTPVYQNGKPDYVGGMEAYIDPLKFLSSSAVARIRKDQENEQEKRNNTKKIYLTSNQAKLEEMKGYVHDFNLNFPSGCYELKFVNLVEVGSLSGVIEVDGQEVQRLNPFKIPSGLVISSRNPVLLKFRTDEPHPTPITIEMEVYRQGGWT